MAARDDILAFLDQEVIKQERLLGLTKAYRRAVLARTNTAEQCRVMAEAKVALLHPSDPQEAKEEVKRLMVGPVGVEFKDATRPVNCSTFKKAEGDRPSEKINVEVNSARINGFVLTKDEADYYQRRRQYALDRIQKYNTKGESTSIALDYIARHVAYFEDNKRREQAQTQQQKAPKKATFDEPDEPDACGA